MDWVKKTIEIPRMCALIAACTLFVLGSVSVASAYQEPNAIGGTGCLGCHPDFQTRPPEGGVCEDCHADYEFNEWTGPHANYSVTSNKCGVCHTVHDGPSDSIKLLPASTISGTCFTCHDGTGGWGVYGAVQARTGVPPSGGHRVETTNSVPGGDPGTGGSATTTFRGLDGNLTCSDCHSPHGAQLVAPFLGDRRRVRSTCPSPLSSKLLKQRPTSADATVTVYGSDWCRACHKGRISASAVHNHPVDSTDLRADTFTYSNVARLDSDNLTGGTVLGTLGGVDGGGGGHWAALATGGNNRGFLMPYPRTPQQGTHYPICQQCHEDSRETGDLSADGTQGDAATASIESADGKVWSGSWTDSADNPLLQNFPHETQNHRMLVEENDDLCLNCHPPAGLP